MTTSQCPSLSPADIPSLITAGFRADVPSPVIVLSDPLIARDAVLSAAFDVARASERPFVELPGGLEESDGLAVLSTTVSDLARAAQSIRVPHAAGSPVQIQQTQSFIASLRALCSAERSVLVVSVSGEESAQDMNLALSVLGEPHAKVGVDLTRTPVFWCGPTAQSLPTAYRNACQVFKLAPPSPRPSTP